MWPLVKVAGTDANGEYSVDFDAGFQSRVYAYYDDPSSPGFDYVPAFQSVYLSGEKNMTFVLRPGASLSIGGQLRLVESARPSSDFVFTVIDPVTGSRPDLGGYVYDYGTGPPCHNFLRSDPRQVIVPAEIPFNVRVNATMFVDSKVTYRTFILNQGTSLILKKGQKVEVSIEASLARFNFDYVENYIELVEKSLDEVERKDFYVALERNDLIRVKNLADKADRELLDGAYDKCYADLREAYIGTLQIDRRIGGIYADATSSVAILMVFLALAAMVLTTFLFERSRLKPLTTLGFSGLFIAVLYYTYPGFRLIKASTFFIDLNLSLAIALLAPFVVPQLLGGKTVSILSIAKQNLRRRRIRLMLTLTSVMVLTMSFVMLTSFSTGYGLTTRSFRVFDTVSEGLMVRRPLPSDLPETTPFLHLDISTIEWLQEKSEVLEVAPKFENSPSPKSIGFLYSSNAPTKRLYLFGVLGIQPSAEAKITHIDETIVRGKYLDDDEKNGVLISAQATESLGVDVGDELVFGRQRATLVGVFDDHVFSRIRDVDAEPLIPQKQVIVEGETPTIYLISCDPSEMIITNWQTARELSMVLLSRIDAQAREPNSALSLAREIALERDLWVWSSYGGDVSRTALGEYAEVKGLSLLIPWVIVVLNVIATMLNSMFERRREVAIFSSVGLNPSHISALFMAEASIIGIIGGSFGYLFGLGGYRAISFLSIAVEVRQKVSVIWCLASLSVALAAVLVATSFAIRYSTVITPSLLLRTRTRLQAIESSGREWEFPMPVRLYRDEVDSLFGYMKRRIQDHILTTTAIRLERFARPPVKSETEDADVHVKSLLFNYYLGQSDPVGAFPFSLVAKKEKNEDRYKVSLICKGGDQEMVLKKVTFVRMLIVDWNAQRK